MSNIGRFGAQNVAMWLALAIFMVVMSPSWASLAHAGDKDAFQVAPYVKKRPIHVVRLVEGGCLRHRALGLSNFPQ